MAQPDQKPVVVLTDHPWPELDIERGIVEGAGFAFVAGPVTAGSASEIEALVAEADPVAILTCWAPVSAKAIASPTRLAAVARVGVGLDNIDVAAATARGAWVTNVPDYCVQEVSDHAVALLLASARGVVALDRAVKARGWHASELVPQRVANLTVGIVGYGRIGRETGRKLRGFGARVLAYSPDWPSPDHGVEMVELAALQEAADVIILHAALTPETAGMIDAAFLARCRRRPLIVNVGRGGLIVNDALLAALESGGIRGAALDVVEGEPDPPAALLQRPDVIVTPHVAYLSGASLAELRRRSCEEVVRILRGTPPEHPCNRIAR